MGYKFIKYLEASSYNTKRFYVDNGEIDLPPIVDHIDIMPGSEALDLKTMKMWVLNSNFEWEPTPWRQGGDNVPEAPIGEPGAQYVRATKDDGTNTWEKVTILPDVPTDDPQKVYVRKYNADGTYDWLPGVADGPTTEPKKIYALQTQDDGTNKWVEIDPNEITAYTIEEWKALITKPEYSEITDSPYDGTITGNMYIDH